MVGQYPYLLKKDEFPFWFELKNPPFGRILIRNRISCQVIIEKKDSKINVCSVLDAIFISEHGSCGPGLSDSAVFLLEGLKKTSGRLHQFEFGSIMVYLKQMNPATILQHRWNSDSLGQRADGKTG